MKRGQTYFIGTGAASIVMIFVVLCLTAFGVLALSTARADLKLTLKTEAAAESYYAADAQAQERLHALDRELSQAREQGKTAYRQAADALDKEGRAAFTVEGQDGHVLLVEIKTLPFERKTSFEVVRYQWLKEP